MGKTIYVKCGCCPKDTHDLKVDITDEIAQAKQEGMRKAYGKVREVILASDKTHRQRQIALLKLEEKLKQIS